MSAMTHQIVNESENEKAAVDVVEEGIQSHKGVHAGLLNPTMEDSLYYADLQYGKNYEPVNDDSGSGASPADSIAKSPIRFLWGPKSPEVQAAAVEKRGTGSLDGSSVDAAADAHLYDRRMLRKVTVFGAFYLITTDILGPFNTGYAISQVGFAPGAILYVVMGVAAFYGGVILNSLYLRLDSDRSPIRNYGQLVYRILGKYGKIVTDILMILQLVVNCGTLVLSNGQSLEQIIIGPNGTGHLCFVVCILIFFIINLVFSVLRTLKQVGWLANAAVWLNIVLIWCTVGFIYSSPPNYAAAFASSMTPQGPVVTQAIVSLPLYSKVNGIMNMVFAYGGAMIFVSILLVRSL